MKTINVGVIGTGWCGGIRANTYAAHAPGCPGFGRRIWPESQESE